ncbi:MAG: hypothetical protein WCD52_25790 [Xanthobacteraceae bacterium]
MNLGASSKGGIDYSIDVAARDAGERPFLPAFGDFALQNALGFAMGAKRRVALQTRKIVLHHSSKVVGLCPVGGGFPLGALFISRINPFAHAIEGTLRQAASLWRLDCRIGADREPAEPAAHAVVQGPALVTLVSHAQREPAEGGVEVFDAALHRQFDTLHEQLGESFCRQNCCSYGVTPG